MDCTARWITVPWRQQAVPLRIGVAAERRRNSNFFEANLGRRSGICSENGYYGDDKSMFRSDSSKVDQKYHSMILSANCFSIVVVAGRGIAYSSKYNIYLIDLIVLES